MPQPTARLPASSGQTNLYRATIIRDLVRQSFDLFNTFGADPESLENKILGFNQVLGDFHTDFIKAAFAEWLDQSKIMPTPSEIKALVIKIVQRETDKKIRAEGGSIPAREANPRPKRAPRPYDDLPYSQWDGATLNAFLADFQNCDMGLMAPLLRAIGWDQDGFLAALEQFKKSGI